MNILVFNCGSSSLTYKIFRVTDPDNPEVLVSGKAHRVGVKGSQPSYIEHRVGDQVQKDVVPIKNHREAAALVLKYVKDNAIPVDYIGHRFVHGGSYFQTSAFLNESALKTLRLCMPLAPIHNPISLHAIYECRKSLPDVPQYVTFDSAFHSTIPEYAYSYPLPKKIIQQFGFRKYGFHGLSYTYVTRAATRFLNASPGELRIIACHLGTGGSSVAAIQNGHSVDTSMGYSPLPGLVMSTRCGDIDPMLMIYLMAAYGYRPDDLLDILNRKSGLLGVSGFSSDITDIIQRISEDEEEQTETAFNMYIHRLRKYVGSYIVVLGGIDVLAFTDDIGVRNWLVREKVCADMKWAGIVLDKKANRQAPTDRISSLAAETSNVTILAVPTEEELVICLEGVKLIAGETHAHS